MAFIYEHIQSSKHFLIGPIALGPSKGGTRQLSSSFSFQVPYSYEQKMERVEDTTVSARRPQTQLEGV